MTWLWASRRRNQRTLGEVNLVAEQSFVRMEEVIRNLQESLEELGALPHIIWRRALAEAPESINLPDGVLTGLEQRGVPISGEQEERQVLQAAMQGAYRFKPRGSVETADILAAVGSRAVHAGDRPDRADVAHAGAVREHAERCAALLEQILRVFRFPDRQAILGSDAMAAAQQAMMPPPMPGMIPGMPPPLFPLALANLMITAVLVTFGLVRH